MTYTRSIGLEQTESLPSCLNDTCAARSLHQTGMMSGVREITILVRFEDGLSSSVGTDGSFACRQRRYSVN